MVAHNKASTESYGQLEPPRKKAKLEGLSTTAMMPAVAKDVKSVMLDIQACAHVTQAQSANAASNTSGATELASIPKQHAAQQAPSRPDAMAAPHPQDEALLDQDSKEAAYGITEFVCPELLGFTGVLKKRYTDFLVNEILPSGQVVHLDNTQAPKRESKQKETGNQPQSARDVAKPYHQAPSNHIIDESTSQDVKPDVSVAMPKPTVKDEPGTASNQNIDTPSQTPDFTHLPDSTPDALERRPPDAPAEESKKFAPGREDPQRLSSVPLSMQDLDPPIEKPENLAPHMRIPAPSQSSSLNNQNSDDAQLKPSPTRKKETVRMRQTSKGWVEVSEQEEKDSKDTNITEDVAPQKMEGEESTLKEEKAREPFAPSTQTSWQAFACETSADVEASTGFQLRSDDLTALLSYFGADVANEILALHDRILKLPHRKPRDHGKVVSSVIDRHTRSKIHQDLRRMFDSRLESSTDNDGAMVITATPDKPTFLARVPMDDDHGYNNRNKKARQRNTRGGGDHKNTRRQGEPQVNRQNQWAERGGDYLHFSLWKENKDTMECISWLTKQLNMKASAFQFAGTKDRRGVTVQRVSAYRVLADRLLYAGLSLRRAKIGNFEYQPHPLQLGELIGNEFVITLRDCDFHYPIPVDSKTMVNAAQAVVGEAITNLAAHGFLNYYGLQRFGTFSTSTDQVGIKMLQGDFKAAVDSILQFNPASLEAAQNLATAADNKQSREDLDRALAIDSFKTTGKAHPALRDLPRKFSTERSIIQHLSKPNSSNDFHGAMQSVSRNMRLMYVHAYQSLVWNMAASERWKRFGAAVVVGDLVLINEHKDKIDPHIRVEDVDEDGEAIIRPSEDDRAADPEDMFIRARLLSKEEAESGKYTIFDIVLPTPGFDIIYPANEIGRFYEIFMASERGGGLDPHDMRRKWKDASLSGSYRKLLARPSNDFSFDIKVYKNDDEQFVETDLDRLEKAKQERNNAQHSRSAPLRDDPAKTDIKGDKAYAGAEDMNPEAKQRVLSPSDSEPGGVKLSGGPYQDYKIAVILKLQLGSSQYATMALRELMKHGGARTWKPDFGSGR